MLPVSQPLRSLTLRKFLRRVEPGFYIAPSFLVMTIILVYPLAYSLWLSFHRWTLRTFKQGIPFIGLENYQQLFSSPEFWNSLRITFTFVFLAVAIEFVLGMGLALLLNHDLKAKGLIRSLILLPMMCTNVVIGLTWRLLFNYEFGIVNYYLNQLGFASVEWLSSPKIALWSVIVVDVWNTTSFVALMLLAGLQSLPEEPFEAARIDGANSIQTFFYLTLPLLRQTILVALLWRLIDTFRIFDVVYLLTAGGPARATETVSIYIYRYGFQSFNLGFASAASYVMILIMLAIAALMARAIGRAETVY
ncbi:MAG: sugar ABC transporter permease [Anaerolineales bacterium]|nr:sugar ABC transporter permease [Anaerolineales bacterium]MCS7248332.1 sugar ABC transporter permease [Anaerolineales bacterium]MDW8162145.1 sugar ABC transporter permease [Anaerolineales bacterium]MDW8447280.1 sugar ABC transporter permease [Anaerolineales bacterium]